MDTGAVDTLVSSRLVDTLQAKIEGYEDYELAGGRPARFPFVLPRIEITGKRTSGRVLCGPADSPAILGVIVLESLGFVVDPKNHTLRSRPLWLK